MKPILGLIIFVFAANAQAGIIHATASLDYAQEVSPSNPNPSSATAAATVSFDTSTGLLDLAMSVTGMSVADVTFPGGPLAFGGLGPLHIHQASAGANGPIVVPFSLASFFVDTATGTNVTASAVPFDLALIPALLQGDLYLNLHSVDYGSGEIRGQLAVVPEPGSLALLGAGLLVLVAVRRRREPEFTATRAG